MAPNVRYFPPAISPVWLTQELLKHYPNYKLSNFSLEDLAKEYIKFWRLVLSYPEKRVVAPGPIIAVQQVHFAHHEAYFDDCMTYFNRFVLRELVWHGQRDIRGAVDTVRAYRDLYHELPPPVWQNITAIYNLKIPSLHVVH